MSTNNFVSYLTFNSYCEAIFSKGCSVMMTPQGRLECLKKALALKIQQTDYQDETINELECHLRRAREDLIRLNNCCGKDKIRQSIELSKYEDKLKQFRDNILGATSHLEKVLRNLSNCHDCKKCKCQRMVAEECNVVHCIRKDLESLEIQKSGSDLTRVTCNSETRNEESMVRGSSSINNSKFLNIVDMENFRNKSVAGMNILEQMKEQVDILHGLVKNYFYQLPRDYEKCQIEKCESKFQKLHEEFDCCTECLSEILDSLARTDKSDGICKDRNVWNSGISQRSDLSDKIVNLQSEQMQLQREICGQQKQLERVKNELREAETILREKKCRLEERDKDLESKQAEINGLRTGVKGFRECLRAMQIEIADVLVPEGSCSSLNILSNELQDLCDVLTSLKPTLPGIIEKYKEENHHMKTRIGCLEKCLENKEQTSVILQKTLRLRDDQIEDLSEKMQSMKSHNDKLNQELCEKSRLIANLQDSMRRARDFEMRIKDECIGTLQFEVCELDAMLRAIMKEVVKKRKQVEILQDEILYISSKNFFLNREIDLLEPKLGKMQKNLVLYETMVCELQKELGFRKCEIEELYQKVRDLEDELECEARKYEQQALDDAERINELNSTVLELQNELECVNFRSRDSSPARSNSTERRNDCEGSEDPCMICRLKDEINEIKQFLSHSEHQEEFKRIMECLEAIINQGKCRQQAYSEINELQKAFEEALAHHKTEKEKLLQKMRKEEVEISKNKITINKLNENIKSKMVVENDLKEKMRKLNCELEKVKRENDSLRSTLEKIKRDMKNERAEMDKEHDRLVKDLETQKSVLKDRCLSFKTELEKEESIKKCLEERINELNEMLSQKTLQVKQLSENYKSTSAEAQKTLAKLKDAEYRLKCIKSASNNNENDRNGEDGLNCKESAQNEDLEKSLKAKVTECNNLMKEVECLQEKLKVFQNNRTSAQGKDFNFQDCELTRKNAEVSRLENELDLVEKENCKLRNDIKMLQDELKNMSKRDECAKAEIEKKDAEIDDMMRDRKALLDTVDDLQKKLEEICIDGTAKEKENKELREQCSRLRKEIKDMETEMCEMKQDFKSLQLECSQTAEKLRCNGRAIGNLRKLCRQTTDENANLEETRCSLEKELNEIKNENSILKQKIQFLKKQKDMEMRKIKAENLSTYEEKTRYIYTIKELNSKVKTLENRIIPQLEEEILRKDRCIENYKMELSEANASGQRMREESLRVIQSTKKYLGAQRNANDSVRVKSPSHRDNRDNEDFKLASRINEYSYYDISNEKHSFQDAEPRSFSPLPWGCSNVERDNSPESGFYSMHQSPTNVNYAEYGQDMKRVHSHWNNYIPRPMENHQSSCRNPATR